MELYHSSKFIKKKFWLAMLQIAIGLISLILNRFGSFFQYGWLIIGLLTLTDCYCDWKNYMFKIDNNILIINRMFFKRKVKLSEFNDIQMANDKLILSNYRKKKELYTWGMDDESVKLLHKAIVDFYDKEDH